MANPNPDMSGLTPFKPGQVANPGGKTSEHRKAEVRAAEAAAKVQADLVEALARVVGAAGEDEAKLAHVRADVLKLLKDAQDRGFGQPVAPQEITSPDGSAGPSVIRIVAAAPNKAAE